jgi:hypothetical protein
MCVPLQWSGGEHLRGVLASEQVTMEFRRRIYRRGSSFETTIPMPLLLTLDPDKRYDCCFTFDPEKQAWQVRFEERREHEVAVGPTAALGAASGSASGAASGAALAVVNPAVEPGRKRLASLSQPLPLPQPRILSQPGRRVLPRSKGRARSGGAS